jgi:hypothetical protein
MDKSKFPKTKAVMEAAKEYLVFNSQEMVVRTYVSECLELNIPPHDMFDNVLMFSLWVESNQQLLAIKLFNEKTDFFNSLIQEEQQ